MGVLIPVGLDISEQVTGRFHKDPGTGRDLPIMGTLVQNGLNDIEPDGSFVPCDVGVSEVTQGVTHLKMNRGRMGELRFGDSGSSNKFLVKIKDKGMKGLSFQYMDADGDAMVTNGGKPRSLFSNGIVIESSPYYKGVKMDIIVNDPLTAPTEYTFSTKTYGQDYNVVEEKGGLTFKGDNLESIYIKAPYAEDANEEIGPVTIHYLGVENNLHIFKKVVDEEWLRQAAAPVRIDPDVTINDDTGTVNDAPIASGGEENKNYGSAPFLSCQRYVSVGGGITNSLLYVDLSVYSGITITSSKFGLDFYAFSGTSTFDYFKVLVDWVEGTLNGTPQTGSSCWKYRIYSTSSWNAVGCEGSGTDHAAVKDGSITVSGVDNDKAMPLTNALTQDWIDNPGNNKGIVWIKPDVAAGVYFVARSSEATEGNKPYFYMEWAAGGGNPAYYYAQLQA